MGPNVHPQIATQQLPDSLSNVPELSSLVPPLGGGGVLGSSIAAIKFPHDSKALSSLTVI